MDKSLLPGCMLPDGGQACKAYSQQSEQIQIMRDALIDARSGMNYIRQTYGELYGVGFDRVENKIKLALGDE